MSKGSSPRPMPNRDRFAANWDAIYAKPKGKPKPKKTPQTSLLK